MTYLYYKHEGAQIENLDNVKKALNIGGKPLMVDSSYLKPIEAAEKGDVIAIAEMAEAFRDGRKDLAKNYNLARYYADKMLDNSTGDKVLEVEAYANLAYLERVFGNFDESIKFAQIGIDLMHNHLPRSEWHTNLYVNIYKALEESKPTD